MNIFSRWWDRLLHDDAPAPPLTSTHVRGVPPPAKATMLQRLTAVLEAMGGSTPRHSDRKMHTSLKMPHAWPGVIPKNETPMAMDEGMSMLGAISSFGEAYEWGGYGFMGYALLAELMQVPEYRRPCEILANEMTRKWVKLISIANEDKTQTLKDLEDDMKTFEVQDLFRRAFELDNEFGRGQIYIDLLGVEPNEMTEANRLELKTPLLVTTAKIAKGSLKGLLLIEPMWTYPNLYNAISPLSKNFYKPQTWYVMGVEVHTTRLLTFVSRPVADMLKPSYMFGGQSLIQLMKQCVENWLRTRQSVGDIVNNFSTPVLGTDMDVLTTMAGAQALMKRADVYNMMRDNQGLFVISKANEEFSNVSVPLGSLDKLQAQSQEHMAAIAGIPLVKYFGITPSGLNASSDGEIRVFYDTIESLQKREGTPALKLVLDILQLNRYGKIDPDIGHVWQPLWSLDEVAQAGIRKTDCDTDVAYAGLGVIGTNEIRQTRAAAEGSRYAAIDVDEMPAQPMQEGAEEPDLGTPEGHLAAASPLERDPADRERKPEDRAPARAISREGTIRERSDDRERKPREREREDAA